MSYERVSPDPKLGLKQSFPLPTLQVSQTMAFHHPPPLLQGIILLQGMLPPP